MQETMTSRQRVIGALNHAPIDRVPIDLGMHYSTGISAFAYWKLREHLGLGTDRIEVCDVVQFLARVDADIMQRFHVDCILLQPRWLKTHRWTPRAPYTFAVPRTMQPQRGPDGEWVVEFNGGRMRMPAGGYFFDGDWLTCEDRTGDDKLLATAREAERIHEETPFATFLMAFGGYFSMKPDFLCRMLTDPDEIKAQNEIQCRNDLAAAAKIIKAMGRHIHGICLNSDLGSQAAPFCRPSVYEELCAPYVKRLCAFIHENSDCKTFLHCCGSVQPMIPILIDAGIDVLNPVQISADNMNPRDLKRKYGDKIVFWGGGCNTQAVLGHGTPEPVAANVCELMAAFKPGSGFVFNQVHNIMGDVPPQNVVVMLDTAYAESFY